MNFKFGSELHTNGLFEWPNWDERKMLEVAFIKEVTNVLPGLYSH